MNHHYHLYMLKYGNMMIMKDDSFNHDIKTKKKIHYHNDYIDYLLSRLITSST
jgi:hypothetical protein